MYTTFTPALQQTRH